MKRIVLFSFLLPALWMNTVRASDGELSADEIAAEPLPEARSFSADWNSVPISIEEASDISITILSDGGYQNESGQRVIDVIEQDNAYLAVEVQNGDGRPVIGAKPVFSVKGKTQVVEPGESTPLEATDESGIVEFGLIGGEMGMDSVTVTVGDSSETIMVNVISHRIFDFPSLVEASDGLKWSQLTDAVVSYQEDHVLAAFPEEVRSRAGKTVKLAGFMLPLEPEPRQGRFLLTSFPPSCFFHLPGGPAGVVEVLADEETGDIEASFSPILIEGEFETIGESTTGIVYRLRNARLTELE